MEKIVQNYLLLFLLGLGAVVTFQNTFLSIKKSFARNYGKTSDILRIICNFGNLSRFLLSIGYFMTPSDVTSTSCKALGYMYLISYHLLRESFFAFMLWTLYRMSSERKDLWIGVTFLLIQTSLLIPTLIFVQPVSILMTSPNQDNQVQTKQCDLLLTNQTLMKLELPKTILEMTMVIYVIFQLIYLKLYRNRRVAVETPTTCETTTNNTVTSTTTTPNVLSARRPLKSSTLQIQL
ncbi:15545_t:CDS:2 [Funneliformis mosseae]|uniref:15545_t:CDS:1 n=1 Tax=Funneliformis mosseae TaxID=27381 RepID=A0A9N9GPY7_FUNMO|nr:15545_t:CDS:2 [Funneliformis mosseae]